MPDNPAIVCFPFVGSEIGGSHISALGLIRNLDRRRFNPLVVLQHSEGEMAQLFREAGVAIEQAPASAALEHGRAPGARQAAQLLSRTIALARFLRGRGVAIVHSNDGRSHATWALPAKLAGAKLLWHHRGDPTAKGLRFVAPLLADRVVAVSHFAAPRPALFSAAAKSRVIHSPFATDVAVDRKSARDALIAELGCDPATPLIGFFGALIERKRPLLFVDAIAALSTRMPDRPVLGLLFGEPFEGAERSVPARAQEHGIADRIRMMGFRWPGTRWLAACDMLMVPAIHEPFGRTLIESMLVGTPVIATISGGNAEALQDGKTGLLVPAENAAALAAAAQRLIEYRALGHAIADNARKDARDRFGEARHAEAIMALYDEMLTANSSAHTTGVHRATA